MTNDRLSQTAIDSIGNELLDDEVTSVEVMCQFTADDRYESEFDVYDQDGSYLFSVSNDGITWNK